jgi:hypothetical protein
MRALLFLLGLLLPAHVLAAEREKMREIVKQGGYKTERIT